MLKLEYALILIESGWHSSFIRHILNTTTLGQLFKASAKQYSPIHLYDFMVAYLKTTLFFRSWFRSYILSQPLRNELDMAAAIAIYLQNNQMLNQNNIDSMARHQNLGSIYKAISILNKAQLLTH